MDTKIIELSKAKILLAIGGSIAFLAVSVYLATLNPVDPGDAWFWRQHSPYFVHGVGIAGAVLCGSLVIWLAIKMFDTKPGLVLDNDGFTDNCSAVSHGFVPWSDVTGLSVFKIKRTRVLVIKVADPERYLGRGNVLRRALVRFGAQYYGSPIQIGSTDLTINFDELSSFFESYWRAWKGSQQSSRSTGSVSA